MKPISVLLSVCSLALLGGPAWAQDPKKLTVKEGDTIALVGAGMGSRMNHFGHFETELYLRFAKSKITIRQLGSHASGLEDAETDRQPHHELTGWKGDFWKRLPVPRDPFTVSRDVAPTLDEPGERFRYSNPGIAMLGYAITDEDEAQELVVVKDEENGINNLIVDCEDPILILEQIVATTPVDGVVAAYAKEIIFPVRPDDRVVPRSRLD